MLQLEPGKQAFGVYQSKQTQPELSSSSQLHTVQMQSSSSLPPHRVFPTQKCQSLIFKEKKNVKIDASVKTTLQEGEERINPEYKKGIIEEAEGT